MYLAVVIDLYNREVIGYAVSKRIDAELACQALSNAIARHGRPKTLVSTATGVSVQQQAISANASGLRDQRQHEQAGIPV